MPTSSVGRASVLGVRGATMNRYQQMYQDYVSGADIPDIAREFDCSVATVYQALKVVETNAFGAPSKVQMAYLVRQRRRAVAELRKMIDELTEQHTLLSREASDLLSKGEFEACFKVERHLLAVTKALGAAFEASRKQDLDLAHYWGVLRMTGVKVMPSNDYSPMSQKERDDLAALVKSYQ